MRRLGFALPGVMMAAMLTVWAAPASATTLSYQLNIDHCTGGCGTTPFGQVDLNDFGGTGDVQITVTLFNGNKFVSTGVGDSFVWNLSGDPAITVTGLPSDFSLDTSSPIHQDGFGFFDYGVADNLGNGAGNAIAAPIGSPLVFDVHASGINVNSFVVSTGMGATPVLFSADIISGSGSTMGNTGPVGSGPLCTDCHPEPHSVVPEPGSLVLLGSGLLFATRSIRRRFGR